MTLNSFITARGKFYRHGTQLYVSASMIVGALTGETFEHVPLDTLERARLEGEGAHRICCNYFYALKTGEILPAPEPPAEYPGTRDEWKQAMLDTLTAVTQFHIEHSVEPLAMEQPSVNKMYGIAGRPDLKCELTWRGRRYRAVPDYKRVAEVSYGHRLQVQIYRMLDAYKDCQKGFIFWLKKGGRWQLLEVKDSPDDHAAICGQAAVFQWQMNKGLLKP